MASTTIGVDLDVTALSGTIGAELRGLDLRRPLDAPTLAAVRDALVATRWSSSPASTSRWPSTGPSPSSSVSSPTPIR